MEGACKTHGGTKCIDFALADTLITMNDQINPAVLSLWGVIIGALLSLVGTVVVPWIRESKESARLRREAIQKERQDFTLAAIAALLDMQQARGVEPDRGKAQARFGTCLNQLTVRLTTTEQPILDLLLFMLVVVQRGENDAPRLVGESMTVATLWVRGDLCTEDVISEVEARAQIKFSADRKTAERVATSGPEGAAS
jgi:hypothetical protein